MCEGPRPVSLGRHCGLGDGPGQTSRVVELPAGLRCVGAAVPLRISKSTGVSALLRRREWKTRGVMGAMDEVIGLAAAHLELFVMGTTPSPRRLRAEAFRRSQPRSHLRLALPREMADAGVAYCSIPNIRIHAPARCLPPEHPHRPATTERIPFLLRPRCPTPCHDHQVGILVPRS